MGKGKPGEWLRELIDSQVNYSASAERSNTIASYILVKALEAGGIPGGVQLLKKPGAITVNGLQLVPERFLPTKVGKSELDIKVAGDGWRSPVESDVLINWMDSQELLVDVARGELTQADVVVRLKELKETKERIAVVPQSVATINSTTQLTQAATAEEVARMLNLGTERVRLTSIHDGGRTPGSLVQGVLQVFPVLSVPTNVATRDIVDGSWQRQIVEVEPEVVRPVGTGEAGFVARNWLRGMTQDQIDYRRWQMETWRGSQFWTSYGFESFEAYYDTYDPLCQQLIIAKLPKVGSVVEMAEMFNRSMTLSVRAAVTAMTDANVAKHIADLAAGRNGDLAWLVDSRRIESMIAKFGVIDNALRNAQSAVDSMLEYCLEAVEASDGTLVVLPADVLATMGAALRSMFTGLEVGRLETAVSFVAAGADPSQISNRLKVDARILMGRR